MRSRRATTCSITCSAPASTGAGGQAGDRIAAADRARDAARRLHGHGRRGARSAARRRAGRARRCSASISPARCWRSGLRKVRAAGESERHRAGARRRDAAAGAATASPTRRPWPSASATCSGRRWRAPRWRACCGRAGGWRSSSSACRGFPGVSALYLWYFRHVLPLVGRLISGHTGAYSYLPASVGTFPPPAEFMTILRQAGFADVQRRPADLRHRLSLYGRQGYRTNARCVSHCSEHVIIRTHTLDPFRFRDRYQDEHVVGSAISAARGRCCCRSSSTRCSLASSCSWARSATSSRPSPRSSRHARQELLRQQEQERESPVRLRPAARRHAGAAAAAARRAVRPRSAARRRRERAPSPQNPLPFSRGNSAERTEAAETERARGAGDAGASRTAEPPKPEPEEQVARCCRQRDTGIRRAPAGRRVRRPGRSATRCGISALRPERDVQQPAGRRHGSRARRFSSTPRAWSSARGSAASSPRCGATGSCRRRR